MIMNHDYTFELWLEMHVRVNYMCSLVLLVGLLLGGQQVQCR